MAKIGLKNFRFGILTEGSGTATYGAAHTPAKAVSCNVSITNNSAMLYADDGLAESDTSFQSGTVTLTLDNDDLESQALLLGHTYTTTETSDTPPVVTSHGIVRKSTDAAPYVGLGRIVTRVKNGVKNYKVEFLNKVKFSEPSQTDQTRGESVEFGTTEIEGTIATLANGEWSSAEEFSTMAAAQTYLDGLFGTTPTT